MENQPDFDLNTDPNEFIMIVVDKLQKKNGWSNDGYSFVLNSKNQINNIDGMETISLEMENDKITAKVDCNTPKENNSYSMNCIIVSDSDLSGDFKVKYKTIFKNGLPKINIIPPSNKVLNIEEKQKLSKGAKIGIILGICSFVVICVVLIILYKTGVLSKRGGSAKIEGYDIAPDKSRNIGPGEIKDNQFNAIMAKNEAANL